MDTNNRKSVRYVFPVDRKISASMKLENGGGIVEARILNISEGGLGLAAERGKFKNLEEEVELRLESVQGEEALLHLKGQTLKVKWILDYEPLNNLGIGCEFVDLNQDSKSEIKILVSEHIS